MFRRAPGFKLVFLVVILSLAFAAGISLADDLIRHGDFEAEKSGKQIRKDSKGQDWYESRKDTKKGRELLKMSSKNIAGNATKKVMIKGSTEFNTYLSQPLSEAQTVSVSAQYDILIKEILPQDNRSGFFFLGRIKDKKGGPNSTGKERFVFMGFENGSAPGKINLFAREGGSKWAERTIVATDLDLNSWYTISVEANIPEGFYQVSIDGLVDAFELESFYYKGKTPDKISHVSFASWNDGAGTFYVDNVVVSSE